jgi:hypothetical protein
MNRIQVTNILIRTLGIAYRDANAAVKAAAAYGSANVNDDTRVTYDFVTHTYNIA